jgi:short-subunit dehydrogenase
MSATRTVRQLARCAIEAFDRIDVWINNAGVGAVGAFAETPIEAHDQVVRTNLLGYLHAAHALLPHFIERGAGLPINNLSFGAWVPALFAAAYSASKFGLCGSPTLCAPSWPSRPGSISAMSILPLSTRPESSTAPITPVAF